jgi:hypothetical protein
MWKKIISDVMDAVMWAERELKGKTGAEKRRRVVEWLIGFINIPFVPEMVETPIERIVYGYLIDRVCAWYNLLGEGTFVNLLLTDEQKGKVIELLDATSPVDVDLSNASMGEKLDALYRLYKKEGA